MWNSGRKVEKERIFMVQINEFKSGFGGPVKVLNGQPLKTNEPGIVVIQSIGKIKSILQDCSSLPKS